MEDTDNFSSKLTAYMLSYSGAKVLATWETEYCSQAGVPSSRGDASQACRGVGRGLKRGEPDPNCKWSKKGSKDS